MKVQNTRDYSEQEAGKGTSPEAVEAAAMASWAERRGAVSSLVRSSFVSLRKATPSLTHSLTHSLVKSSY